MTRNDGAQRGRTSKRTPYKKRRKCCSKFLSDRRKSLIEKAIKKSQRSNLNLERKIKRKSISNIHLHHHRAHLIAILMRLNIEAIDGKESTDSRFWVISEEDQYKQSTSRHGTMRQQ